MVISDQFLYPSGNHPREHHSECHKAGADGVKEMAKKTQKAVDQAASKGILHKNTAARRNSRIARAMNKQA